MQSRSRRHTQRVHQGNLGPTARPAKTLGRLQTKLITQQLTPWYRRLCHWPPEVIRANRPRPYGSSSSWPIRAPRNLLRSGMAACSAVNLQTHQLLSRHKEPPAKYTRWNAYLTMSQSTALLNNIVFNIALQPQATICAIHPRRL